MSSLEGIWVAQNPRLYRNPFATAEELLRGAVCDSEWEISDIGPQVPCGGIRNAEYTADLSGVSLEGVLDAAMLVERAQLSVLPEGFVWEEDEPILDDERSLTDLLLWTCPEVSDELRIVGVLSWDEDVPRLSFRVWSPDFSKLGEVAEIAARLESAKFEKIRLSFKFFEFVVLLPTDLSDVGLITHEWGCDASPDHFPSVVLLRAGIDHGPRAALSWLAYFDDLSRFGISGVSAIPTHMLARAFHQEAQILYCDDRLVPVKRAVQTVLAQIGRPNGVGR